MDYRDFTDENTGVGCHFLLHGSSDHELLIAKFRFKLKKVGKTSRPFRYDLNKIPYDYTVEETVRQAGRLSEVHSTRDLSHVSC